MNLPYLIEDNSDFIINPIGRALENIRSRSYSKIELFKSFSEMIQQINSRKSEIKNE